MARILMQLAPPLTYERVCQVAEEEGWDPQPREEFDPSNYAASEFGLEDVWATVERDVDGLWYAVFPLYPWSDRETGEVVTPGPKRWHVPSEESGVAMVLRYRAENLNHKDYQEVIERERDALSEARDNRTTMLRECGIWDE